MLGSSSPSPTLRGEEAEAWERKLEGQGAPRVRGFYTETCRHTLASFSDWLSTLPHVLGILSKIPLASTT